MSLVSKIFVCHRVFKTHFCLFARHFFCTNITLTRETRNVFWERPVIKNTPQKYLDNTCCSFRRSMGTVCMRGCVPLSWQIRYVWILWGRRSERRQLCASPPLTSATSMTLLRIAIFKREPSLPPADETVIIRHLHDKCVCLCTHLCMYVWVLKRTLAAVRREFLSFISAQKMGRGPFLMWSLDHCLFALHLSVHH